MRRSRRFGCFSAEETGKGLSTVPNEQPYPFWSLRFHRKGRVIAFGNEVP